VPPGLQQCRPGGLFAGFTQKKSRFRFAPEAAFRLEPALAAFKAVEQDPVELLVALLADFAFALCFYATGVGAILASGIGLVAAGFRHQGGGEDCEREGSGGDEFDDVHSTSPRR